MSFICKALVLLVLGAATLGLTSAAPPAATVNARASVGDDLGDIVDDVVDGLAGWKRTASSTPAVNGRASVGDDLGDIVDDIVDGLAGTKRHNAPGLIDFGNTNVDTAVIADVLNGPNHGL